MRRLLPLLLLVGCASPPVDGCLVLPPEDAEPGDALLGVELAWAQASPEAERWGFERHADTPASAAAAALRCRARGASVVVGPLQAGLTEQALDRAATADLLLVVPQAGGAPPDGWPANAVSVAPPPGSEGRVAPGVLDAAPDAVVAELPADGRAFVTARAFGPQLAAALPGRDVWGVDGPGPPDRIGATFPERWGRPASALAVAGYESLRLGLWLLDQEECAADARRRLLDGAAGSVRGPSAFVWSAEPQAGGVRFQASADWIVAPLEAADGGVRLGPPRPAP